VCIELIQRHSQTIILNGKNLTVATITKIINFKLKIEVGPATWQNLDQARAIVLHNTHRVYGLNTSVGQNKDISIAQNVENQFNNNLVKSHLISTGKLVPTNIARIVFLIRINQLLQGVTGINPALVRLMIRLYNADVLPVFYSCGSVGEADIGILSALAQLVIGRGQAWYHGSLTNTEVLFKKLKITAIQLGPKDALAVLSSNAYGVGQLIYGVNRTRQLLKEAVTILGLSLEGFDANVTPILPVVSKANHNDYEMQISQRLRSALTDSYLFDHHQRKQVQDPISFRSATHILGAALHTVENCIESLDMFLSGSDDNPLVCHETGQIVSTGNFEVIDIALVAETVGQALTHVSRSIFQRIKHLNNDQMTGLPRFLIQQRGFQFGLQTLQKTAMDADVRIRQLAYPISAEFYGLAGDIEDHSSNLPLISEKLVDINTHLSTLLSLELYNAAQAVYLRLGDDAPISLGIKTARLYTRVRKLIPPIIDDRPYNAEIEKVRKII
jgi:histidine ammonia-lyase